MEPVSFGAIEVAAADHLAARLPARGWDVLVANSVPRNRPETFVLVVPRVGGGLTNIVTDNPRLVVECHSTVGTTAGDLAAVVRAELQAVAGGYMGGLWIEKVGDISLVFRPDPDTNLPRYLVTKQFWVTGAALT